jgi:hypothetical protein
MRRGRKVTVQAQESEGEEKHGDVAQQPRVAAEMAWQM